MKINNAEKPSSIQAESRKYQEVRSVAETKGKTNTIFYNRKTKTLYVSIPVKEGNEIWIR
ncbi:hypothetical protein [Niallia sp. 03133]|uniref:hypothetical protein n=1 Tax=Niallia sp. 03133 TaxID=3458060 RepID=UPI004043A51D